MLDNQLRPPVVLDKCTPPTSLVHMVIRTSQAERMIQWYHHVLGARIVFQDDIVCFLTYDEEHHRIALLKIPRSDYSGKCAIDHVAFAYADLGKLLGNYYRLKRLGIEPVRTINHGPTISFYYRDPENIMLELQVDNFAGPEEADAFFRSPNFAENPIGVLVDPDELRRAWESGAPWDEIRVRPPLPKGATPRDMQKERQVPRFDIQSD